MPRNLLILIAALIAGLYASAQSYQIGQIPYAPDTTWAGQNMIINQDDVWSGSFQLPFQFCVFDSLFDKIWLGSNGQVTFTPQVQGTYCPWPINAPIPNSDNPPYTILAPLHDINPSFGGSVKLLVTGIPPYRRVIITWIQNSMFSCTSSFTTQQVHLCETTNIIEMHIINKPLCSTWNGGASIQGLLINDSVAFVVPGRNYPTQWSAQYDAYALQPQGNCSGMNPLYSANGIVYADVNSNCTFDSLQDYTIPWRAIIADGGQYYTWTDAQGRYSLVLQPGLHTITEFVPSPYLASNCTPGGQYQPTLTGLPVTGLDFADSASWTCPDLHVGISSPGIHRCDTSDIIYIDYGNAGMLPDSNATITVQLHDSIQPYWASIPYLQSGPNAYTFTIGTLNPFSQGIITLLVRVGCEPALTVHCLTATIQGIPGLDCNGYNDYDQSCLPLNAPFDPNSKSVADQDFTQFGYVASDTITATSTLLYRVDFQNIGTSEAHTVEVTDVIDTVRLDLSTLQMVSASHAYNYLLLPNRLVVRFEGINLPDSNTSEPLSHGYFHFRIQQRPGNPDGTVITNRASIRFDQETPITTNAARVTIPLLVGSDPAIPLRASAYPNPGSTHLNLAVPGITDGECTLLDITGRTVATQKLQDGKATIPTAHLPSGVYGYVVTQAGIRLVVGKWVRE